MAALFFPRNGRSRALQGSQSNFRLQPRGKDCPQHSWPAAFYS